MKVIFLDIDGVLNPHDWWKRRPSRNLPVDPEAVARLDRLIVETGAAVVLSSTWRTKQPLHQTVWMLAANGLTRDATQRFLGTTAVHNGRERGREIDLWVRAARCVEAFATLDDDSDMDPHMDRLVQTSVEMGLRDEHCARVREMLSTPAQSPPT